MNDAAITAFSTIIVGACTTIASIGTIAISNLHNEKIKRIELFETRRVEIVEQFIRCASDYARTNIPGRYYEYAELVFLYLDKKLWKTLDKIEISLSNKDNRPEALTYLREFCYAYRKFYAKK